MTIDGLEEIVAEHPLFHGLGADFLTTLTGCASNVRFAPGTYLFHEGEKADRLFLIREGLVALEIAAPGPGRMTFQTVGRRGLPGHQQFGQQLRFGRTVTPGVLEQLLELVDQQATRAAVGAGALTPEGRQCGRRLAALVQRAAPRQHGIGVVGRPARQARQRPRHVPQR